MPWIDRWFYKYAVPNGTREFSRRPPWWIVSETEQAHVRNFVVFNVTENASVFGKEGEGCDVWTYFDLLKLLESIYIYG
jgi:hypothetical protein